MKPSLWELHKSEIIEMRQSGYTLQEIGDYLGVTRERVRQMLQEHCGKIEIPLLVEEMVAKELGCPQWRLRVLRKRGVLNPINRGKHLHYYHVAEIDKIRSALETQRSRL